MQDGDGPHYVDQDGRTLLRKEIFDLFDLSEAPLFSLRNPVTGADGDLWLNTPRMAGFKSVKDEVTGLLLGPLYSDGLSPASWKGHITWQAHTCGQQDPIAAPSLLGAGPSGD